VALDTAYEADAFFKEHRDSLWRVGLSTIREQEYEPWFKKNNKYISEVIETMWQNDRRLSWETERFETWVAEKNEDKEKRWVELKEALWMDTWMGLWKDEEIRLSKKNSALRRMDLAVNWAGIMSSDKIESLVGGLNLPNNAAIWKKVTVKTDEKGSKLYKMGVVPLFRDALIGSVNACPVAGVPYLIHVQDTSTIKRVSITCPIRTTDDLSVGVYKYAVVEEDTLEAAEELAAAGTDEGVMSDSTAMVAEEEDSVEEEAPKKSSKTYIVALNVDPVTMDTTKVRLSLPMNVKLFGGGAIRNHGDIDEDGKKSWMKNCVSPMEIAPIKPGLSLARILCWSSVSPWPWGWMKIR